MQQATIPANSAAERIISTIGELPASPAIVSAVMGLTSSVETDISKLVKVLSADQALTAKVLKLSNSSFYGRSKGVSTLKEAILILGFYTLRSLVIASSTHSLYKRKDSNSLEQALWEHSLATAISCKEVAREIHHNNIEEAFIAGLMHDLGKLILSQKMPAEYDAIVEEVRSSQRSFLEVEMEILGFNHVDVAKALFDKWNFPTFLSSAIYYHHRPDSKPVSSGASRSPAEIPLAYIVNFCDQVARHVDCGFDDAMIEDLATMPLALKVGLKQEKIDSMLERLAETCHSEKHVFDS